VRLNPDPPSQARRDYPQALEKDRTLRYQNAADLKTDLRRLARDSSQGHLDASSSRQEQQETKTAASNSNGGESLLLCCGGSSCSDDCGSISSPTSVTSQRAGQQRVGAADILYRLGGVYPTVSSDGRMLAFIRGDNSFIGHGDVYVKLLPGGDPIQLTHDSKGKLAPSFSPNNSRISYGHPGAWDTWEVPVLGGEPHLLLPNASSLTWIEGGRGCSSLRLRKDCIWPW